MIESILELDPELYRDAAWLIENVGWTRNHEVDLRGDHQVGYCAIGAMRAALGAFETDGRWRETRHIVGAHDTYAYHVFGMSLPTVNDLQCKTALEVVQRLRFLADVLLAEQIDLRLRAMNPGVEQPVRTYTGVPTPVRIEEPCTTTSPSPSSPSVSPAPMKSEPPSVSPERERELVPA